MPHPTITEEELQRQLADPATRRSAFATVVHLYSKQIYWQIRRMVYVHEDADDLVQNTFIKAWEAIGGFSGEAKVSTWLYRIATYEALNFIKKRRSEEEQRIDAGSDEEASYELRFQKALLSLPPKQQLVFRLRYYDEMPYEEMAALTGTSEGALKASYHLAMKKVTEQLKSSD